MADPIVFVWVFMDSIKNSHGSKNITKTKRTENCRNCGIPLHPEGEIHNNTQSKSAKSNANLSPFSFLKSTKY
jgi:hypothetical protein